MAIASKKRAKRIERLRKAFPGYPLLGDRGLEDEAEAYAEHGTISARVGFVFRAKGLMPGGGV